MLTDTWLLTVGLLADDGLTSRIVGLTSRGPGLTSRGLSLCLSSSLEWSLSLPLSGCMGTLRGTNPGNCFCFVGSPATEVHVNKPCCANLSHFTPTYNLKVCAEHEMSTTNLLRATNTSILILLSVQTETVNSLSPSTKQKVNKQLGYICFS